MALLGLKTGLFFAAMSTIYMLFKVKDYLYVPPIPAYEEQWWGPGEPHPVNESIRPFRINVSQEILDDLKYRLENTLPFQKPLVGVKHHYGINTNLLQNIMDFWKTEYNWREREKYFNKYPHFLVNIQGLDIHFIRVKPETTKDLKVLPLLVLHGWLGSVREMYELIPLLTTPRKKKDFVFEVIVVSLPGFGYSDGASKPNLGSFHIGVIMKNLMLKLGFEKFYVQGTDWGGAIVQHMSVLFEDNIVAMHSNMCIVRSRFSTIRVFLYDMYPELFMAENEDRYVDLLFPLTKLWSFRILEGGYFHIQSTKPDTIGVGLRESPAGLAAYMLEKFITLANPAYKDLDDGGLEKTYGITTLIDNIMLYWVTNSITTSMRIYAEDWTKINREDLSIERIPITIPTGCARFRHEVFLYPEGIMREKYQNLIHLTNHEGGHFPALEVPETLAEDIFTFIDKVNKLNSTE